MLRVSIRASGGIHSGPEKRESPFDRVYAVQKYRSTEVQRLRGKGVNVDVANGLHDGESQSIITHLKYGLSSGGVIA